MFRSFARHFLPNPFDAMLKRTAKKGGRKILFAWNRGLGDIALGLYAMVQRTRELVPDAEITFLIRPNLKDGFSMLEGVKTIIAPNWKRGEPHKAKETLLELGIDPKQYDLIIEKPSPTDWVYWQRGKIIPKLKWNPSHEELWKKFGLSPEYTYIGVQAVAETNYGLWRNWPQEKWEELFVRLRRYPDVRVLLFGFGEEPEFEHPNVIDLRGKTALFELLSIIKNRCQALILPDSGISSMTYYLDASFPMNLISLWADANHGILKQNVPSPNSQLVHSPLVGENRDLSTVSVDAVMRRLFPLQPLAVCPDASEIKQQPVENVGCIILAGGQGSRLGVAGPKGMFPIHGKALFQWICERAPKNLPIAVMTSPLNHQETVAYFERHDFFGLDLHFFQQEMQPLLDEQRRPIEIRPGETVQGPNGNGNVFRAFVKSGLAELFKKKGVDLITVVPVDNPLSHPSDPAFVSYARQTGADALIKCVEREQGENNVGVLALRNNRIEVVEYTEIAPEELEKYRYANIGHLAFRLSFMEKISEADLPLHWVQKKVQVGAETLTVWKGEQYIFDAFPYADKVEALSASRSSCFAPLKNLECLEAVQQALQPKEL